MALMKTSNPALSENTFRNLPGQFSSQSGTQFGAQSSVQSGTQFEERYGGGLGEVTRRMTMNGTVNKTGILLVCAIASAGWTWMQFQGSGNPADVMPWMMGGLIGGFIFALITTFKKKWSPI